MNLTSPWIQLKSQSGNTNLFQKLDSIFYYRESYFIIILKRVSRGEGNRLHSNFYCEKKN